MSSARDTQLLSTINGKCSEFTIQLLKMKKHTGCCFLSFCCLFFDTAFTFLFEHVIKMFNVSHRFSAALKYIYLCLLQYLHLIAETYFRAQFFYYFIFLIFTNLFRHYGLLINCE